MLYGYTYNRHLIWQVLFVQTGGHLLCFKLAIVDTMCDMWCAHMKHVMGGDIGNLIFLINGVLSRC